MWQVTWIVSPEVAAEFTANLEETTCCVGAVGWAMSDILERIRTRP